MPLTILRQDITKMQVDAIVNAANSGLRMGGGVCGAIFQAAGAGRLQAACDRVSPVPAGGAAVTPGFALPAKYVIHAVGPIYHPEHRAQCEAQLRSAYTESLRLARRKFCKSIAFPLISSGIYGYPKEDALRVAVSAIRDELERHDMDVYLAVFDKSSFCVSQSLLGAVESYIDQHYVDAHSAPCRQLSDYETQEFSLPYPDDRPAPMSYSARMQHADTAPVWDTAPTAAAQAAPARGKAPLSLDALIDRLDEPFSTTLLKLIDAKGKTDTEVYKRANIDRKHFSKIRTGKGYTPRKPTILALAVALELSLSETGDLLQRAGYALSHASKFDVIVEYFIVSGNYDIDEINSVLFQYDQPLLGA